MAAFPSAPEPGPVAVWWLAARPATLAASVAPVLVGVGISVEQGGHRPLAGLGALLVGLAMQIGVNYANDYSDHRRGTDRDRVGPWRAAASGVVRPGAVRTAAIASFAIAALVGLALSLATNPWLLVAGAAAVIAGWLYTGGPKPYGYLGLGEVFTFVFFGLMATAGTVYVIDLAVSAPTWWLAISMGLFPCAILAANNLRDMEGDRRSGKKTLAVRLGRTRARYLIGAFLIAALVAVALAALSMKRPALLLVVLTLPLGVAAFRGLGSTAPNRLIGALKQIAVMELVSALLIVVGLLL
ncbi:MAG: 1,4-dihydroxy-2-naphthoate polyprenyltransferase [Candidatus Dormibacteraceae bacterium]